MITDRDINYIKALKGAEESMDEFIERIDNACKIIKEREEKSQRYFEFDEMIQRAGEIIGTKSINVEHLNDGFIKSIKVQFYL